MMEYELLDIRTLPDPQEDADALAEIPDWRRDYILRYKLPTDRKRSLGAWRLLEKALTRHGCSVRDVTVGEHGKLICKGVCVNLSHSGDMALCVISDVPVGCDIEQVKDAPFAVAKRVFTAKERRYLDEASNPEEANRRFFRLWTMKESYLKMTGEGLGFSPAHLEINPMSAIVLRDGVPQNCEFYTVSLDNYEIAICQNTK